MQLELTIPKIISAAQKGSKVYLDADTRPPVLAKVLFNTKTNSVKIKAELFHGKLPKRQERVTIKGRTHLLIWLVSSEGQFVIPDGLDRWVRGWNLIVDEWRKTNKPQPTAK